MPARPSCSAFIRSQAGVGSELAVGVDLGSRYCGIAFMHLGEAGTIRTVEAWPGQDKRAGQASKTLTALLYARQPGGGGFQATHWGWEAQQEHLESLSLQQQEKTKVARDPTTTADTFFVTDFRKHLDTNPAFVVVRDDDGNKLKRVASSLEDDPDPGDASVSAGVTAEQATTHFLERLKCFALDHMRSVIQPLGRGLIFRESCVHWCLVVPSAWGEEAQQRLQACAVAAGFSKCQITVVPDDDAAAAFCISAADPESSDTQPPPLTLLHPDPFLVVDAGVAGTSITERWNGKPNGTSDAECKYSPGCGGDRIDKEFVRWLAAKVGQSGRLEDLLAEGTAWPPEVTAVMAQWEAIKRGYDPDPDDPSWATEIRVPQTLQAALTRTSSWAAPDPLMIDLLDDWTHNTSSGDQVLELSQEDVKSFFDPLLNWLVRLIQARVAHLTPMPVILLGDLASFPYLAAQLQQRIADVTVLPDPASALMRGAVFLRWREAHSCGRICCGSTLRMLLYLCANNLVNCLHSIHDRSSGDM